MVLTPVMYVLLLWGLLAIVPDFGYPVLFGIGLATLIDVTKKMRASTKEDPRPPPEMPLPLATLLLLGTLFLGIAASVWASQLVQQEFRPYVLGIAWFQAVPKVASVTRSLFTTRRVA